MHPPQMLAPEAVPPTRPRGRTLESLLTHRWARLLIPSLSDLFFLAILVWLFAGGGAGWQSLLADADAGWHIRTGQYIVAHHAVPHTDLYSFSKPGAPWYAWEWGADVFYGSLDRLAGLKGVVLAAALLISLFATTILRRMIWRGTHPFIALGLALLCIGSASIHFLARPHLFTLLLLSISIWMLEADRERPSGRIWWLVPLTAVWTNLHGGFLVLIAAVGLAAAGEGIESWVNGEMVARWWKAGRYCLLALACGAASLLNPYGYHLHQHIFEYLQSDWIRNVVQEFQSPSFRTESMMQFEILLLAGLIVTGALLRRRRVVEALWILFFAHEALASARHVPVFVAIAGPVIAFEISQWWGRWTAKAPRKSLRAIVNQMAGDAAAAFRRTSVWPAAVAVALMLTGPPIPWPKDFPELLFPVAMVHAHGDMLWGARVLTTDQWADYLLYTHPGQKVFVDGRSDFYGPQIGNEYIGLINGRWDWRQVLHKYDFNAALVPVELPIAQLLKTEPGWRVIADDGKRILFIREPATLVLERPAGGNQGSKH